MAGEAPAPVEAVAPAPEAVAAAGNFAGKSLLGEANDFDFSALLDPNFDTSSLTVEGAAVRGPEKTWASVNLAAAESTNMDTAATNLNLTPEEYSFARQAGLLRPESGNPGEVSTLSDEQRAAIVAATAEALTKVS